jgi:CRISPR/Cas system CSM-associated protein Csm3 (group 7 of RAMP superfamily)
MPRDFIEIQYQIEFNTPFHFGTGLRRDLIDRSVARDAQGYLYLPGSTMKGVLREKCEQIARLFGLCADSPHDTQKAVAGFCEDIDIVDRIFGSRYKPGGLYFDNVTMFEKDKGFFDSTLTQKKYIRLQTETRTQTNISRILGVAREQALYQSEFGIKSLRFGGRIYGYLEGFHLDDSAWSYSLLLLLAGIRFCDRIGANKSTGMGEYCCEILKLKVNNVEVQLDDLLGRIEELLLYDDAREELK